jgi:hypothetical protein
MAPGCHCACHNVTVHGHRLPPGRRPHGDRFRVDDDQPILKVHCRGISIRDPANATPQSTSEDMATVTCHCHWQLTVQTSTKREFCQFTPPGGPLSEPDGSGRLSDSLHQFFLEMELIRKLHLNDDEEEMMFPKEVKEPFVGSYSEVGRNLL